uniref:Uncharacterized protein n=1 Tax=Tanacetum cinerariifolium TaxID=118510 RepID=A0A6L2L7X4_TANCI|nr:hypothetical protein [Tanacetum cinerariifolium]
MGGLFSMAGFRYCFHTSKPEPPYNGGAQLRKDIDTTLGSGILREAVRKPPREERWSRRVPALLRLAYTFFANAYEDRVLCVLLDRVPKYVCCVCVDESGQVDGSEGDDHDLWTPVSWTTSTHSDEFMVWQLTMFLRCLPLFLCLISRIRSKGAQLRKHIDTTLGSGVLREATRKPLGEEGWSRRFMRSVSYSSWSLQKACRFGVCSSQFCQR